MKKSILLSILLVSVLSLFSQNHWQPNPYQFPDNMNAIAVINLNGIEQTSTDLEIGVFCDDECRGSERIAYYESIDRHLVFLTMYGAYHDPFEFKLYDHAIGRELDVTCDNEEWFVSNRILGELFDPYVFEFHGGTATVTVEASPANAGMVDGGGEYELGSACTVCAMPNFIHDFVRWECEGQAVSTDACYTFNVTGDCTMTAIFELRTHTVDLHVSPDENAGTVEGGGVFTEGDNCTAIATANYGYSFIDWKEYGVTVSTNPTYTFAVMDDRNLTACFEPNSYVLSADVVPQNGGTVSGTGTYTFGQTVTLTATPASSYYFINWMEADTLFSTNPSIDILVNADRHFVVTFAEDCRTIDATADPEEGGNVTGAGNYIVGSSCTLTANANPGYSFMRWTENGQTVSNSRVYTFTVDANRELVAHFMAVPYEISVTVDPQAGGTVTGAGVYYYGDMVTLTISPAPLYYFMGWYENGECISEEISLSFAVERDRSLTAVLMQDDEVGDSQPTIMAYPNPVSNRLYVKNTSESILRLYDLQGHLLIETEEDSIDMSTLPAGLYLLNLDGMKSVIVKE